MTPTTWLFCLSILWTKAVDTQEDEVPPLIMAVYGEGKSRRITLTDFTAAEVNDLKWPLDVVTPTFIALLCNDDGFSKSSYLAVKQVTNTIHSIKKKLKCSSHFTLHVEQRCEGKFMFYDIGVNFRITTREIINACLFLSAQAQLQKIMDAWNNMKKKMSSSSKQSLKKLYAITLTDFMDEFGIERISDYKHVPFLTIQYNLKLKIPTSITHTVIARMHSNKSVKTCENEADLRYKLGITVPSGFQRRQLVPMEDFNGIYTTQATCIHVNYILLRNEASESLESIEIFTRKVADVINEVDVISGTYIKKNDDSVQIRDESGNAIPTIVWKKISYKSDDKDYAVLVVIHNQETETFCDKQNEWGWPEHNIEEEIGSHEENSGEKKKTHEHHSEEKLAIGTMYYCLMNPEISQILRIKDTPYKPFNLYEIQHKGEKINILERIAANNSSSQTEQQTTKQA